MLPIPLGFHVQDGITQDYPGWITQVQKYSKTSIARLN